MSIRRFLCKIGLHALRPGWESIPGMPVQEFVLECRHCGARFRMKGEV